MSTFQASPEAKLYGIRSESHFSSLRPILADAIRFLGSRRQWFDVRADEDDPHGLCYALGMSKTLYFIALHHSGLATITEGKDGTFKTKGHGKQRAGNYDSYSYGAYSFMELATEYD